MNDLTVADVQQILGLGRRAATRVARLQGYLKNTITTRGKWFVPYVAVEEIIDSELESVLNKRMRLNQYANSHE